MQPGGTSRLVRYGIVGVVVCAAAGAGAYIATRSGQTPGRETGAAEPEARVPPAAKTEVTATPAVASQPRGARAPNSGDLGSGGTKEIPSQDERYRQLVVGTWEDDYQGKRTMTLKDDGTGTMIVELSGFKATLFAKRLQFDMVWSLEDGRLRKRTTGGQPEGAVNLILKMMGDSVDEPILELTENRLLLLDKDGETQYDWRRKQSD
jgi:hypothetical protein